MTRRTLGLACLLVFTAGFTTPRGGASGTDLSLERAERLFAEGSYGLAHEVFVALDGSDLGAEANRWVDFRLADTAWRSAAATASADDTVLEQARQDLERMAADRTREAERDRVWAEAQESIGDFWWVRPSTRNWGAAWPWYERALDWWGRSSEIDLARARYLAIVWKAAEPPQAEPWITYGYYGNQLPEAVLRNVLRISDDPTERAHAWFLIAMGGRWQGGMPGQLRRVSQAFEAALEAGRESGWYDDALYHYAEWLTGTGRVVPFAGGGFGQEPDYPRALELFRRLTREFTKGETRHYDAAMSQIEAISAPQLGVAVPEFYLPGSDVRYQLSWRNTGEVDLALYPVDLTRDVTWKQDAGSGDWLQRIEPGAREASRTWTWSTNDDGRHVPGQATLEIEPGLPAGAYLLEARAAGQTARELVLVSSASLVLKTSNRRALAFLCDAVTGAPRGGASVRFSLRTYDGAWSWSEASATTDGDGLARIDLPAPDRQLELFVAAADGEHQAFAVSSRWIGGRHEDGFRLYVFTDRPAYRPGERASFKVVARRFDGAVYSTPAGRAIRYEIADPRGGKPFEGTLELNRFGSAWGEVALGAEHPLGEYRVTFHDPADGRAIGSAVLLRLEEYKLPEYRVEVRTPLDDDGRPRALQVGEPVEAEVVAEYYFGGPVADASVEVLVYQRPLWIHWQPEREFPWFYDDMSPRGQDGFGATGQVVHRETSTTNAEGRALVRFEPPFDPSQDFEYTVEARVIDASRREISGRGSVRASRQRYFAFLNAAHNLYRPGDEVRVTIRTLDANERPLGAEGRVRVTRDRWVEVWVDSAGREVTGDALERVRRREKVFPPPGWRPRSNGYEHEEVLARRLTTGDSGEVELAFTPAGDGFYRVAWLGDEEEAFPVAAETTVWVADPDTVEIGYRPGGVQVLVDSETFRVGRTTPVMISAPAPDSWVLFSVEAEELHEARVVHLTGTVKLLELSIGEQHVPNVFLDAAMVRDGELHFDSRQVVVPPVEHYLEVEIAADREEYRPRERGTWSITTRDHAGNAVPAEVAIALVDESVFQIQQDYAGDPRQFFYGTKRAKNVTTASSFHIRRYAREHVDEVAAEGEFLIRAGAGVGRSRGDLASDLAAESDSFSSRQESAVAKMSAQNSIEEMKMVAAPAPSAEMAGGAETAVQVRSDFRATALWMPDIVTGPDGTAEVEVAYPDSLTTWKATARVATTGNAFGLATASARTKKPLIVRLQAPRFFVVGDRTVVSAVINNNTDAALDVAVALEANGLVPLDAPEGKVRVAAGGESRVDWRLDAREAGPAELRVVARGGEHDDAMALDYRVHEHGIEKLLSRSGKVRGDEAVVTIDLPSARRAGSDSLTVQVTPSLAVTMLDALPYLIDYPYGCTEQTMSRFLPAVITARTLEKLGLDREEIAGRIFGGIEPAHAGATHPDGAADLARLEDMVRKGLARLYEFQHADGGWGWWKDGESDHFMTAYVVWGLGLAREAGVGVDRQALRRGVEFLDREIVEAELQPDLQAWMLHALAAQSAESGGRATAARRAALDNLWAKRDLLNAYARALLALSAHHLGDSERAAVLARNLANGVKRDRTPDASVVVRGSGSGGDEVVGTAHWGEDGLWWRWADGPVESTAFALRALLAIDPDHELIEPVTSWLVRNRRGAQWSNTRDTAIAVLALGDYLRASGELQSEVGFEIEVNGRKAAGRRIDARGALSAPSRFEIDPAWLRDGPNEIRIARTSGAGALYFSADARFFSLEEPILPAGNEIFARRDYAKLAGRPTLLAGHVYDRQPLRDGQSVTSGERVEVSVIVEAKNDYEYLVFEDLKPAGLEAVQIRSGQPVYARELTSAAAARLDGERDAADYTGRARWVYQELRDRNVVLFVDKLPQGVWEIRYELRAEVPGSFHALPLVGHAMYVPEIRCNGAEVRIEVHDAAREITRP